ncbi:hypothetical protein [Streptomyces sp. NPDC056987]|uniref:hypothetical protein n=1 Tax=Streptomyces sp. NPDC056987 TaxID=3345988 RepID=UPI003635C0E5
MADLRRPPEWEQPADRHTELIDPVITVRQLSRFEFARKLLTRIDHALVFSTPKGSYDTYLPPLRPTRAEAASRRYTSVYEVDMGVHPVRAELTLPSDNDAFEFGVIVDLSWQVDDPARFVAGGHRDVPRLLLGELEQAARPVARRFAIADSAAAEQEMLRAVAAWGPLGSVAGLRVSWTARLRRDQENIDHQLRMQAIHHSAAEQILAQQRGMDVDMELDRRNRQQDALQVGRALDYGRQQQDLVLQQQQWQHEHAMLQARQQVEMQKLEAEKVAFYQWHLEQGGVHAWALHLAQHPEDSQLVMNSMREDQLRLIQAQIDLANQLIGGDSAEDYELEAPKQLALRTVSNILNQHLPGVPQQGYTTPQLPPYPGQAQPGTATGQEPAHRPAPHGTPPLPPRSPEPGTPPPPDFPPSDAHAQAGATSAQPVPEPAPPAQDAVPGPPQSPVPGGLYAHPAARQAAPYTAPMPQQPSPYGAPLPQRPTAAGTFEGWQPPPGYGSPPVVPAPGAPPPDSATPAPPAPRQPSAEAAVEGRGDASESGAQ